VASALVTGCGRHAPVKAIGPTPTTAVAADTWSPPGVGPTPGTANFCALLSAVYTHEATLSDVPNPHVREDIVADYIRLVPRMISVAPPAIASAAGLYFKTIAAVLTSMENVALNASKLSRAQLASLLLDPRVKAAGDNVMTFSEHYCHYTIGG
jgi:hypothetical protein